MKTSKKCRFNFLVPIIFSLLLIILQSQLFCQANKKLINNFDVLDSLTGLAISDIALQLQSRSIDSVKLNLATHPASWMVLNKIADKNKFPSIKIFVTDSGIVKKLKTLDLAIKHFSVQYSALPNSGDSLLRTITVELFGTMSGSESQLETIKNSGKVYKDIISRSDVESVKAQYDFANSSVPEKDRTFFEEIAEPFIVVTSAVLIVVLLFTVRSK